MREERIVVTKENVRHHVRTYFIFVSF